MDRIPLLQPSMPSTEALIPYLRRIEAARLYTNFGPLCREFERRLEDLLEPTRGPCRATTVANATLGLELSLMASGLRSGARVLIPAITFVATATAIQRSGMVPVIADVDPETWCLTPAIARQACASGRIDAVVPVATFGCALDPSEWDDHARAYDCRVIIDAAGAFGNQVPGTRSDVVYSFHATKAFGAGEGGAVVSSSEEHIARVRHLSNFGIDTRCGELIDIGTNGKMSEYHCAVALASFDRWKITCNERRALFSRYCAKLRRHCPTISWQRKDETGIYPLMPVLLPSSVQANQIADRLDNLGISTRRWYCPPLHLHPALRALPRAGSLAVSEQLGRRILGLPFFLGISDEQIDRVVDALSNAIEAPEGAA